MEKSDEVFIPSIVATDFTKAPIGTLVTWSEYHKMEKKIPRGSRFKLGILVGKKFFEDVYCGKICLPLIHWEEASTAVLTHPCHIKPFRSEHRLSLPMVEMEK